MLLSNHFHFAVGEQADDHVLPNNTYTYTWYVTERAAPGPADGSSVVWMYHSHTHEIQDSYAGLLGAIIVTRAVRMFAAGRIFVLLITLSILLSTVLLSPVNQ